MKKAVILSIGMFLLFIVSVGIVVSALDKAVTKGATKLNEQTELYKSYIGKSVVINKDTLTVVDYSLIKSSFTLSDKSEVNYSLVESNIIKE